MTKLLPLMEFTVIQRAQPEESHGLNAHIQKPCDISDFVLNMTYFRLCIGFPVIQSVSEESHGLDTYIL